MRRSAGSSWAGPPILMRGAPKSLASRPKRASMTSSASTSRMNSAGRSPMAGKGRSGEGKIALVTGGGTGIGYGIAEALAAEGYVVFISGRRHEVLERAAEEI